jgi:hypothetical protein
VVNVHCGNGQIFQLGYGGVKSIAQRHGFSRAAGGGHQFTGLFADFVIERDLGELPERR